MQEQCNFLVDPNKDDDGSEEHKGWSWFGENNGSLVLNIQGIS